LCGSKCGKWGRNTGEAVGRQKEMETGGEKKSVLSRLNIYVELPANNSTTPT